MGHGTSLTVHGTATTPCYRDPSLTPPGSPLAHCSMGPPDFLPPHLHTTPPGQPCTKPWCRESPIWLLMRLISTSYLPHLAVQVACILHITSLLTGLHPASHILLLACLITHILHPTSCHSRGLHPTTYMLPSMWLTSDLLFLHPTHCRSRGE